MDPLTALVGALVGTFSGALTLLWWVARLIYTGRLVTAAELGRVVKDRDDWRAAYFAEVAVSQEQAGQVRTVVKAVSKAVTP